MTLTLNMEPNTLRLPSAWRFPQNSDSGVMLSPHDEQMSRIAKAATRTDASGKT